MSWDDWIEVCVVCEFTVSVLTSAGSRHLANASWTGITSDTTVFVSDGFRPEATRPYAS